MNAGAMLPRLGWHPKKDMHDETRACVHAHCTAGMAEAFFSKRCCLSTAFPRGCHLPWHWRRARTKCNRHRVKEVSSCRPARRLRLHR